MPTPQEKRRIRLSNDYGQMVRLRGSIISWEPLQGTAPYIEKYRITVNVRTIIGVSDDRPTYRDRSVIDLTLPPDYPENSSPYAAMQTKPKPFHPNWYPDGHWCYGEGRPDMEGLGEFVIRMVKTLQFDAMITGENSPADRIANDFYKRKKSSGLFPCDRTVLPSPTGVIASIGTSNRIFRIN
jgi:hypothetical protein